MRREAEIFPTTSETRQERACTSAFDLYRQVVTEPLNYRIKDKCVSCIRRTDLSCNRHQQQVGPARLPRALRTCHAVRKSQGLHWIMQPSPIILCWSSDHFTMDKACSTLRTGSPGVCWFWHHLSTICKHRPREVAQPWLRAHCQH